LQRMIRWFRNPIRSGGLARQASDNYRQFCISVISRGEP
jgi:hypothetical protein